MIIYKKNIIYSFVSYGKFNTILHLDDLIPVMQVLRLSFVVSKYDLQRQTNFVNGNLLYH